MAEQKEIKILHKKSAATAGGGPKLPTSSQLEYGEIAINYSKGNETISFKNNSNEIVTLQDEVYVGNTFPTGNNTVEIWIDESETGATTEVYSKDEIDANFLKGSIKTVAANTNINTFNESTPSGTQLHIIYTNTTGSDTTVTVPTSGYKTPDGQAMTLTVPAGGYAELNLMNIGGVTYVRGV